MTEWIAGWCHFHPHDGVPVMIPKLGIPVAKVREESPHKRYVSWLNSLNVGDKVWVYTDTSDPEGGEAKRTGVNGHVGAVTRSYIRVFSYRFSRRTGRILSQGGGAVEHPRCSIEPWMGEA